MAMTIFIFLYLTVMVASGTTRFSKNLIARFDWPDWTVAPLIILFDLPLIYILSNFAKTA